MIWGLMAPGLFCHRRSLSCYKWATRYLVHNEEQMRISIVQLSTGGEPSVAATAGRCQPAPWRPYGQSTLARLAATRASKMCRCVSKTFYNIFCKCTDSRRKMTLDVVAPLSPNKQTKIISNGGGGSGDLGSKGARTAMAIGAQSPMKSLVSSVFM